MDRLLACRRAEPNAQAGARSALSLLRGHENVIDYFAYNYSRAASTTFRKPVAIFVIKYIYFISYLCYNVGNSI